MCLAKCPRTRHALATAQNLFTLIGYTEPQNSCAHFELLLATACLATHCEPCPATSTARETRRRRGGTSMNREEMGRWCARETQAPGGKVPGLRGGTWSAIPSRCKVPRAGTTSSQKIRADDSGDALFPTRWNAKKLSFARQGNGSRSTRMSPCLLHTEEQTIETSRRQQITAIQARTKT